MWPFKKKQPEVRMCDQRRTYQLKAYQGWDQNKITGRNALEVVAWKAVQDERWTQEPYETVWVIETQEAVRVYTRYSGPNVQPTCTFDEPAEPFINRKPQYPSKYGPVAANPEIAIETKKVEDVRTDEKQPESVEQPKRVIRFFLQ